MAVFRELRVYMLNFGFLTPKRHILGRNRVVWLITRENRVGGLGCRPLEVPKMKKKRSRVNILMRYFAHTGKETP